MKRRNAIFCLAWIFTLSLVTSAQIIDLTAVSVEPSTAGIIVTPGIPFDVELNVTSNNGTPFTSFYSYQLSMVVGGSLIPIGGGANPLGIQTVSALIPAGQPTGNFLLLLTVLSTGGEQNFTNNTVVSSSSVTLSVTPDLSADDITTSFAGTSLSPGDTFSVTYDISNSGAPLNPPNYNFEIRLSANTTINSNDPLLFSGTSNTFGSNTVTLTIPNGTSSNQYFLGLVVTSAPGEINTGNNVAVSSNGFLVLNLPAISSLSQSSGHYSGLNTITINGTALTNLSEVRFGANLATSLSVLSPTQVTCTVPASTNSQTGLVSIQLIPFLGTNQTFPDAYEYRAYYPGSNEDIQLGASTTGLQNLQPGAGAIQGSGGDIIAFFIGSPLGTLELKPLYLLGQAFLTGPPPTSPSGFPEIHFDLNDPGFFIILDAGASASFFGPPVVLPGGNLLQFSLPVNAAGFSAIFQAIVLDNNAANGWFAATDGIELQLVP